MRKYELSINGKPIHIEVKELSAQEAQLEVNGTPYTVDINKIEQTRRAEAAVAPLRTVSSTVPVKPAGGAGSDAPGKMTAPIPGSIMEIYVKVGDVVQAGQPLYKMEAMKMENEINARTDGEVRAVYVSAGDSVNQGQEILELTPTEMHRRKTD